MKNDVNGMQAIPQKEDKSKYEVKYSEADLDRWIEYEHSRLHLILGDKAMRICKALGFKVWVTGNRYSFDSREYLVEFPDGYKTTFWSPPWSDLEADEDEVATCLHLLLEWSEKTYKVEVSDEKRLSIVQKVESDIATSGYAKQIV